MSAELPSGGQHTIVFGDQQAVVVEVGAALRSYRVAGYDVLSGYGESEMASSARGQALIPWPNRLRNGHDTWNGTQQQLPLTEPPSTTRSTGSSVGRTGGRAGRATTTSAENGRSGRPSWTSPSPTSRATTTAVPGWSWARPRPGQGKTSVWGVHFTPVPSPHTPTLGEP